MHARLHNITIDYGKFRAVDDVSIDFCPKQIHAVIGENGAGKSSLMSVIFGFNTEYRGKLFLNNTPKKWSKPSEAISAGVGMIHQHFMLVDSMSVLENIILGAEPQRSNGLICFETAAEKVCSLMQKYNFSIDISLPVSSLSVGQRQIVEILKTLYRSAELIILDEPTAVLTPLERKDLFRYLEEFKAAGKTIILITHKLDEVIGHADHVSVLRAGKLISSKPINSTSREQLRSEIIGAKNIEKTMRVPNKTGIRNLKLEKVCLHAFQDSAKPIDLNVHAGEIVGIAGVAGNGQAELVEAIIGLRDVKSGSIEVCDVEVVNADIASRRAAGLCYIPEDRQKRGLAMNASLTENSIISSLQGQELVLGPFILLKKAKTFTKKLIDNFRIKARGPFMSATALSGGNKQKLIVARELSLSANVILAENPTWGIDVGAITQIHNKLLELRQNGCSVLLVSSDLDEIMTLSDRIHVMFENSLSESMDTETITENALGELMLSNSSSSI